MGSSEEKNWPTKKPTKEGLAELAFDVLKGEENPMDSPEKIWTSVLVLHLGGMGRAWRPAGLSLPVPLQFLRVRSTPFGSTPNPQESSTYYA